MKTSKKVNSTGGIIIPKDMRIRLGWTAGKSLDLETTEDGGLLIRPHMNRCCVCNTLERVHRFRNLYICEACVNTMKEEIV